MNTFDLNWRALESSDSISRSALKSLSGYGLYEVHSVGINAEVRPRL